MSEAVELESDWAVSKDGPHKIGDQRRWLARKLMDSKLTDEEAFSVVCYHPSISDLWKAKISPPEGEPAAWRDGVFSPFNACCYRDECRAALTRPAPVLDREAVARKAEELILAGLFDHPAKRVHGAMLSTVHLIAGDIADAILKGKEAGQ